MQAKADTRAFPGTLPPPPQWPQLHITSSIATTAVFTVYFHTFDLVLHHPMLMLLLTKEGHRGRRRGEDSCPNAPRPLGTRTAYRPLILTAGYAGGWNPPVCHDPPVSLMPPTSGPPPKTMKQDKERKGGTGAAGGVAAGTPGRLRDGDARRTRHGL